MNSIVHGLKPLFGVDVKAERCQRVVARVGQHNRCETILFVVFVIEVGYDLHARRENDVDQAGLDCLFVKAKIRTAAVSASKCQFDVFHVIRVLDRFAKDVEETKFNDLDLENMKIRYLTSGTYGSLLEYLETRAIPTEDRSIFVSPHDSTPS